MPDQIKTYKIEIPFVLLIFGASGDLAKLKLFPAIYSLIEQNRLPDNFFIFGFARTVKTLNTFRNDFKKSILEKYKDKVDKTKLNKLLEKIHYFQGQYSEIQSFRKLKDKIFELTNSRKITKIAYFSVPPTAFKDIIQNLGKTKHFKNEDIRLVLEKPFGEDTKSAQELFHFTANYFKEDQIYLLDHYLSKAAVQSILHLRHGNRILNLLLKGPEISNIQITASEKIGVNERAGYFDQVGTLKDMVQSHLLQVMALLTMSIPISLTAENIQREKFSIISALTFPKYPQNIVLGQYESYKKEKNVPKNSKTETFVALRLFIDRESWYKVPIYIRTGKKLNKKHTYIIVEFKKFAFQSANEEPNRLYIELQPEERMTLRLLNRHGISSKYEEITSSQSIGYDKEDALPEHGILLLDIIRGRKLRFLSFAEIIATWKLTDTITSFIRNNQQIPIETYKDNSEGPASQNKITKSDNCKWFNLG